MVLFLFKEHGLGFSHVVSSLANIFIDVVNHFTLRMNQDGHLPHQLQILLYRFFQFSNTFGFA